jgi:hypothetical protein
MAALRLRRPGRDRSADLDRFRVSPGELHSLKAIAELAHAGEILGRRDPARGRRWLEHAWSELDRGAVIAELAAAASRNALLATLLPPFSRAGLDSSEAIDAIDRQLGAALFSGVEWAYLCPVLDGLGIEAPASGRRASASASLLATRPDPWTPVLDAAYQLTHEVFYATVWGGAPDRLDPEAGDYLRRWTPSWIDHRVELGDTDLVAELIMVARIAGVAAPVAAAELVAAAQRADGSIAGPADREVAWHHPTLVAIMAWSIG